jgi:hypothetical protein
VDDGAYFREDCQCCVEPWTPIIVNFSGALKLSGAADGVLFDFAATGSPQRMAWPLSPDNAWLVMDRNGNRTIDDGRELFGNRTPMSNGTRAPDGFAALEEFDGNRDGVVDARDPGFERLALWQDVVRDGTAEPSELVSLETAGVVSISVNYRESKRRDEWGNLFRYRAPVSFASGRVRFAYDVFLVRLSVGTASGQEACGLQNERIDTERERNRW